MKKYVLRITLLLLIFVTVFVGCHTILNLKIEKYTGPQTVEGLMEAFDARYSSQAAKAKTKWAAASETSSGEKRQTAFTVADIDAKYPRAEWLQMLLNKGGTIENFEAYSGYLNVRSDMILKEFHTENDWEIVKASYIDTLIQEFQHEHRLITEANRIHPETEEWFVIGENALPQIPGRIYVQKTESTANIWHTTRTTTKSESGEHISTKGPELSEKQKLHLLNTGVQPAGWEIVYVDEDGNPIR